MTLLPTFGVAVLTVLVSDKSICCGPTVAAASSSSAGVVVPLLLGVESTSGWLAAWTWVKFVLAPAVATVAVIWSVALAPAARVPTVQSPVPAL